LDEIATLGTGASVTVVVDGSATTLVSGRTHDEGELVSAETLFSVQSVSKLLTAARIHTLARAGQLSLSDGVRLHLPGVKLVDERGEDHAGVITVDQLLRHRGGLPHNLTDAELAAKKLDFSAAKLLTTVTDSLTVRLRAAPGTYGYSNLGYMLLGAIIEREGDCAFADCMNRFMAEDLKMHGATFIPSTITGSAAYGKVTRADGGVSFWEPRSYQSRFMLPYGGLWTSTAALAHFGEGLRLAEKEENTPLHAMTQRRGDEKHGAGPVLRERFGVVGIEHDGGGPGFLAWLSTIPSERVTVAVAVNGFDETNREQGKVFKAGVDAMIATLLER
jgi:CubicO group peptidase (beta-lactamase class C family)